MTGEKCRLNEVVISIESLHSVIEINSLFCFAQTLSVTLAAPKLLTLGKRKKNKFSFHFALVYSYLCTHEEIQQSESGGVYPL